MGVLGNMRINKVKIKNYRNLDGIDLVLNQDVNFIVGENDLGKSNFLDLLDKVFNSKFKEEDFDNKDEDINIDFSLVLDDNELGAFNDYFNPEDGNEINMNAQMGISDDYISYYHIESGDHIKKDQIKCANFIKYSSLRNPADELTFYRNRGVGKLLNFMIKSSYEKESSDEHSNIVNIEYIEKFVEKINDNFSKIRIFEEFGIETSVEEDPIDLISRILRIKDSKDIHITKIGHGVQFSVLIILSILEKLMNIIETRTLEKCIFESEGDKSISLILGLDEPEIHLHPYRQRNVIKYIKNLLNSEEEGFKSLIKEILGIDYINGQAIVVTHSPNILTDNYKQITRFYQKEGNINVKSGSNFNLDKQLHKTLLKYIPYVKESFFSKCTVIVEGDSECGALPIFAKKDELDLDKSGISIIQSGGFGSMIPLAKLLKHFDISNVGIMDLQEFNGNEQKIKDNKLNIYSTAYKDFEDEIYRSFRIEDYIKFIGDYFPNNIHFFNDEAKKLGKTIDFTIPNVYKQLESFSKIEKYTLKKNLEKNELIFLGKNKSIIMGIDLANSVSKIPDPYLNLLKKAKRLSDEQNKA